MTDKTRLGEAIDHALSGKWRDAHEIVQRDEDSELACWIHAVLHHQEGDLPNARYWYGQAKRAFPAKYSVPDEIAALKLACD